MSDASTPDTSTDATASVTGAEDAATGGAVSTADSTSDSTTEKLEKGNRRFTRWRKRRPFAGGLLTILAGAWILTPAYLSMEISNIQIQVSTLGGVSTLVIGILLIVCGLMTWFRSEVRIFTGVAAMVLGIVALPQSNLGGFLIGTLLAVIGGALALAWVPQSKLDAKADKAERKARKAQEKAAKKAGGAAAAAAVLTALAVGVGSHSPEASAQLPGLPDLQLPTIPGLPGPGGTGDGDDDANTAPGLQLPELPPLPQLPTPGLQDGNALQDQLDGGLEALGVEIPGLNVAPPAPLEGLPISGQTFIIKADTTDMTPNMKMSLVTVDTARGPRKAFRIDSDRTVLTNLRTQFPSEEGTPYPDFGQDTQGTTSVLTGNFHIIIKKMTITAELMGVNTMLPITLDADWAPDQIIAELSKMGLGLPDFLSGKTTILNGTMETYLVSADKLEAPTNAIGHWAE